MRSGTKSCREPSTRRWRRLWPLALLALGGCASVADGERRYCELSVGMTTDQLAECGCLLNDTGSLSSAPIARSEGNGNVQSVIIVNYICPLGKEGVARVSVFNGIADGVFY